MVGSPTGVGDVLDLVREDLGQSGTESGICQFLEQLDQNSGGTNLTVKFMRQRFCPPPDEPTIEFERFEAGGDPCKLYDVTFQTVNNTTGETSTQTIRRNGPIRANKVRTTSPPNRFQGRDEILGGDGVNCLATRDLMSGYDDIVFEPITSRITAIVPVDGLPDTNTPFPQPPETFPPNDPEPFEFTVNVNLGGVDVSVPLIFSPIINTNIGPFIPVTVGINPDFNLNVDLNVNPQFKVGIDVDLNTGIEFTGPIGSPRPLPGAEPVERPDIVFPDAVECEQFDYERIEDFILAQRCCKPITNVVAVGSFTFDGLNDVAFFDVPNNTVAVFIGIVPGENARAYKLAGANSEYGHGNASLMVRGNALGFERLYVNNHVLFYPEESDQKRVRISCGKGTIVNVNAGLYVPTEEM